ncbi:MAG: hypothetical protein K8U03_02245 [Planctomycetia bacterium]|nr:hypothetical protein [Planctomycetia bacterium]
MPLHDDMVLFGPLEWLVFLVLSLFYCSYKGYAAAVSSKYDPKVSFHPVAAMLGLFGIFGVLMVPLAGTFEVLLLLLKSEWLVIVGLLLLGWPFCFLVYYFAFQLVVRVAQRFRK